jgi:DNA topoisomerase-2
MVPWYSGFTGSIVKNGEGSYEISGVYSKVDGNTIRATDIPIGVSIEDYKMFLETFVENNTYNLVSMVNGSDEVNVSFTLRFNSPLSLNKFLELGSESYKVLKLVKNLSTRNMHLFDEFGVIQKYNSPEEILKEFVKVRINYYSKRKEHIVSSLTRERLILENKYRFVTSIIDGTLVVNMKSKSTIESELANLKFLKIDDSFDYLLKLPVYSFTKEKVISLKEDYQKVKNNIESIKGKSNSDLYFEDLSNFKTT